jgi:hypothetical protein
MSEAGEPETPSLTAPPSPPFGSKSSRDAPADVDGDGDGPSSKKSRGNELSSDDMNGFEEACARVLPFFTGSVFPSIPRSSVEGMAQSTIAAACAHMVTTKSIQFPFHRQFTSDDEVKSMVNRCDDGVSPFLRVFSFDFAFSVAPMFSSASTIF